MSLSSGPNLGLLVDGVEGEEHYDELMRQFRGLDFLIQSNVVDKDLTAPPGGPADGAAYIVGASATGAWATHDGELARYSTVLAGWEFYEAKEGWEVWVADENKRYRWNGAAWGEVTTGGESSTPVALFPQLDRQELYLSESRMFKDPLLQGTGTLNVTSSPVTITDDTKYDAWPNACWMSDGRLLLTYTRGDSHVADNTGKVVAKIGVLGADGESITWGSEFDIYDPASLFGSSFGATRLSTGRLIVTWWVVDGTGTLPTAGRAGYHYSDDNAATWTIGADLHAASEFAQESYCSGAALELPNGDILIPIEGTDSGDVNNRWVKTVRSTDGGDTFGDPVTIRTYAADTRAYYESQLVLLRDGTLKALHRVEASPQGYYVSVSSDQGATDGGWGAPVQVITGNVGRPSVLVASTGTVLFAGRDTGTFAFRAFTSVDNLETFSGPQTIDATMYLMVYAQPVELPTGAGKVLWLYGYQPTSSLTNSDIKSVITTEDVIRITAPLLVQKQSSYTFKLADSGRCFYHDVADTTGRSWTIPDNADVQFPVGTVIDIEIGAGAGSITLEIDSDDIELVTSGAQVKTVSILTSGQARLRKVKPTLWRVSGVGVVTAPLLWSGTDKGAATTLSNGNHTATFGTPAGSTDKAAVRSTTSHNAGKRQFDFIVSSVNNPLTGIALSTANILKYPGEDANAIAIYAADGDVYKNNSTIATAGAGLTLGATYSFVYDCDTGDITVYNAAGSSLVTLNDTAFLGQDVYVMAGAGAHTGANSVVTIDGSPAVLRGGALPWDAA